MPCTQHTLANHSAGSSFTARVASVVTRRVGEAIAAACWSGRTAPGSPDTPAHCSRCRRGWRDTQLRANIVYMCVCVLSRDTNYTRPCTVLPIGIRPHPSADHNFERCRMAHCCWASLKARSRRLAQSPARC